jgi:hypothetical protein
MVMPYKTRLDLGQPVEPACPAAASFRQRGPLLPGGPHVLTLIAANRAAYGRLIGVGLFTAHVRQIQADPIPPRLLTGFYSPIAEIVDLWGRI